ncbi:BZ3500_MvSof-1268-A1-R1_Chr5-3g08285 [Microbotryum saponariae]|uniref:BZ3500_MvSof-1268-A1-R1_Chr5-3g08285 protein n=1 Tax=Microbotryum saponariae TaxID=289078 RepID=A0A2X0M876_9BASI|nr:BZ3500_MvSof-1268-A1-R1_Chr5-3g08285 [Microbotryum saponariae]SDA08393.1 BZ3501_MvSof-1269-A2-R1_Chr5-3g08013 [Microbotryum saponariae]
MFNVCLDNISWNCGLADWARHDCVGIASTAQFIRAHPDSVWFLPICDENHWFLGRIAVKHGACFQNTFSCGPAIVNVVEHELVHEKAFDPTHAALSRIRQFCRAVDMIEAQEPKMPNLKSTQKPLMTIVIQ